MENNNNTKSYALITGASSGIGAEFAKILASKGINLLLIARRGDKLTEVASKIISNNPISVITLPLDLTKPDSANHAYTFCKENNIQVDYLLNNAGFGKVGDFKDISWEVESEMIDLNVKSLVEFTKLFGSDMVNRKFGRILNVASTAAFIPGPRWAVYFASKAFVLSYSEAIATELKPVGVSVTTLCPGPTQSEFGDISGAVKTKLFEQSIATSEDVAVFGINAMMKGKGVVVHGLRNKIMSNFLVRITPRSVINKVVGMLTKDK
jgi:short-subunit dehydrogenase